MNPRPFHFWCRNLAVSLWGSLLVGILWTGASAELIPTPDFTDHTIPTSTAAGAPAIAWQVVDVLCLLLALSVATYCALVSRSRYALVLVTVGSLIWFGFVRGGCVCPIGATQNVALALGDSSYTIPLVVVAFFTLPLVFTLFFGRTFCAAVCPLGALQELVSLRRVQVPRWLDQSLGLIPYLYLGLAIMLAATGTAFVICRFDPFVAMFRLSGSLPMLIFGGGLLALGVFVGRPYCRYLCPYGALLRLLAPLAKWQVRIPPAACIQCRLCEDVCPYDAIRRPTDPVSAGLRRRSKRYLLAAVLTFPLWIVLGLALGGLLDQALAAWAPEVTLAHALRRHELGIAPDPALESYQSAGRSLQDTLTQVTAGQQRVADWGRWLGAWTGLVIGAKLIQLARLGQRREYEPDASGCVACGRCFRYCPVEQVRLGLIQDPVEVAGASR